MTTSKERSLDWIDALSAHPAILASEVAGLLEAHDVQAA
jgi:hypothetical protein